MSVWFTSDTHFGHKNIMKYCNRPFSSVEEMNETLIENWNSCVKQGHRIYHLGDFGMTRNTSKIFQRLNGQKHLILGNHDELKDMKRLNWASIKEQFHLRVGGNQFHLNHYPSTSWRNAFHGSYDLFGHVHSTGDHWSFGLSLDVGTDFWDYKPVHMDEVVALLNKINDSTRQEMFMWRGHPKRTENIYDILYFSELESLINTVSVS